MLVDDCYQNRDIGEGHKTVHTLTDKRTDITSKLIFWIQGTPKLTYLHQ